MNTMIRTKVGNIQVGERSEGMNKIRPFTQNTVRDH